jgi:hypothetical protein
MNTTLRLPKQQLDGLSPAEVEAYLRARGWEADPALSSPEVGVYHRSGDPATEILVPRDKDLIDYALRLSEVVQALAAVERRTAWAVLDDLSGQRGPSSPNGPVSGLRRGSGASAAPSDVA